MELGNGQHTWLTLHFFLSFFFLFYRGYNSMLYICYFILLAFLIHLLFYSIGIFNLSSKIRHENKNILSIIYISIASILL